MGAVHATGLVGVTSNPFGIFSKNVLLSLAYQRVPLPVAIATNTEQETRSLLHQGKVVDLRVWPALQNHALSFSVQLIPYGLGAVGDIPLELMDRALRSLSSVPWATQRVTADGFFEQAETEIRLRPDCLADHRC